MEESSVRHNQRLSAAQRHGGIGSARLALLIGLGAAALLVTFQGHTSRTRPQLRTSRSMDLFERSLQEEACGLDCCQQFESEICPSDNEWINALPFSIQILLIVVLISLSALFSGLTLGLMSLDKTGLEIVMSGDDPVAAKHAQTIYPVREDGNLLLCTLLLGNVSVNALLSILLAEYTSGSTGLLVSTFLIVIFGEIVPQALCSRFALRIGSATVPAVKVIRFILYILAKPLAFCLDVALGKELTTTYSSGEMMKLLQIHLEQNVIDQETAGAMTGALTYKNITVKEVMTPIARTFMLSVDDKLSFETIAKIFKTGYSRIPVYEVSHDNVIGLLFVKDLIFIDPEDEVPIRSFVQIFGRGVHLVWPDDTLGDVLAELKQGRTHLALVRDVNNADESQDPFYEIKGIITLEDIIEKILGDTIVDETDAFADGQQLIRVQRSETFEWARLRLLDTKIVDELLSPSEVKAVTAHLRVNYADTVKLLTDLQLARLIASTPVSNLEAAKQEVGKDIPDDLLYEKGSPSDTCTLVLGGKVTIMVGSEDFRSDLSAWSILGRSALENPDYVPDFTAFVSDGPCRCLRLKHKAFVAAVDASAVERTSTEKRAARRNSSSFLDNANSIGENLSQSSSEAPNRREKIIAQLLTTESAASLKGTDIDPNPKTVIVRFEDSEQPTTPTDDAKGDVPADDEKFSC